MLYIWLFIGQNWDSEISWISKSAHRDHRRAGYSPGPFSLWHHCLGSSSLCMPTQDTCGHPKPVSQPKNVSHFNEIKQNAIFCEILWNFSDEMNFSLKPRWIWTTVKLLGDIFPWLSIRYESRFPFSWTYLEEETEMGTRGWFVPPGVYI